MTKPPFNTVFAYILHIYTIQGFPEIPCVASYAMTWQYLATP